MVLTRYNDWPCHIPMHTKQQRSSVRMQTNTPPLNSAVHIDKHHKPKLVMHLYYTSVTYRLEAYSASSLHMHAVRPIVDSGK